VPDRLHLPRLLAGGWRALAFEPFRPGVEICRLADSGESRASLALLRYQPGASVPAHRHDGLETILVLEGSQRDEHGHYAAGDMVVNPVGSKHSVSTDEGCVVLIQWERPVRMLGGDA
jgi:anti-sigma factor ChrR (cupin superfamily)